MDKARAEPNYKTLTRIIQVVKAVFADKIGEQEGKKKGDEDAEMEEDEEEKKTDAHKHKMFSKSLQPDEY